MLLGILPKIGRQAKAVHLSLWFSAKIARGHNPTAYVAILTEIKDHEGKDACILGNICAYGEQ